MKVTRRGFLGTAAAVSCGLTGNSSLIQANAKSTSTHLDSRLTPYLGQFWASANSDFAAGSEHRSQLEFIAGQGFHQFSDNSFFARPEHEQAAIVKIKNELGLKLASVELGTDLSQATWAGPAGSEFKTRLANARDLLKRASTAGAETVVLQLGRACPLQQQSLSRENQEQVMAARLRKLSKHCDDWNLTLLIEPLQLTAGRSAQNGRRMFVETHRQALQLCQTVDHPRVRLLYDVYRQHQLGANVAREIEKSLSVLGAVQLADGFRQRLSVRLPPGQGEVNFAAVMQVLDAGQFAGWLGMEHGVVTPGAQGEQQMLSAYRTLSGGQITQLI